MDLFQLRKPEFAQNISPLRRRSKLREQVVECHRVTKSCQWSLGRNCGYPVDDFFEIAEWLGREAAMIFGR